jgi:hypothetical protein
MRTVSPEQVAAGDICVEAVLLEPTGARESTER